jgi:hypothetical protein
MKTSKDTGPRPIRPSARNPTMISGYGNMLGAIGKGLSREG